MNVTADRIVVKTASGLDSDAFGQCLRAFSSPAAATAGACFKAVSGEGVDPLFALAIFLQESTMGKAGTLAARLCNPGNSRSSWTGAGSFDSASGFWKYPNWPSGFQDLARRLVDPNYVYAQEKRTTIKQIIERWAPASDGNDPAGYIAKVVKFMTAVSLIPTAQVAGFPVSLIWAYDVGPWRDLSYVTKFIVHCTEGASLAGDINTLTAQDSNVASCHVIIAKDGSWVFTVGLNNTAWTPGNDDYAIQSINVELQGYAKDGYTDAQYKSLANFFKFCVAAGCPIPPEYVGKSGRPGVLYHADVPNPFKPGQYGGRSGHTDPGVNFKTDVFLKLCKGGLIVDNSTSKLFSQTGKLVGGGFWTFYQKIMAVSPNFELLVLGYPKTNEFKAPLSDGTYTVQLFERGALVWKPQLPAPFDVTVATVADLEWAEQFAKSNNLY